MVSEYDQKKVINSIATVIHIEELKVVQTCPSSFRSFTIAIEISMSVNGESIYLSSRSVNTPFELWVPSLATCPLAVAYMMHTFERASSFLAESPRGQLLSPISVRQQSRIHIMGTPVGRFSAMVSITQLREM